MRDMLNQDTQEEILEGSSDNTILNVIFISIIMGMAIVGYMYGNFGSVSQDELEKEYIRKSAITYNTLNVNEKNNYIEKDK